MERELCFVTSSALTCYYLTRNDKIRLKCIKYKHHNLFITQFVSLKYSKIQESHKLAWCIMSNQICSLEKSPILFRDPRGTSVTVAAWIDRLWLSKYPTLSFYEKLCNGKKTSYLHIWVGSLIAVYVSVRQITELYFEKCAVLTVSAHWNVNH